GHVAHGVVDDAVALVDGIVVRRFVGGLDAAALIDRDVDHHGAFLHAAHHVLGDHDGRPAPGDEYGADHEVGLDDGALDRPPVRRHRDDAAAGDLVDEAQSIEVLVEQPHLGFHAGR